MKNEQLRKLIDELATLLALNEPAGSQKYAELLRRAADSCELDPALRELRSGCERFAKDFREGNGSAAKNGLGVFVEAAQCYLEAEGTEPFFVPLAEDGDIRADADREFFVDFIEKYSTLAEELEETLSARQLSAGQSGSNGSELAGTKEFNAFIKAYIHTLKGDSGAVGFVGIERVCHELEDGFNAASPDTALDSLWQFKDWLKESISAYAAKRKPARTADELIALVRNSSPAGGADPGVAEDMTNYDLLRELMGDDAPASGTSAAPAATQQVVQAQSYTVNGNPGLFAEFTVEAEDHLTQLETVLLQTGGVFGEEDISTIFRAIHSIKGASAYFNLLEISETSHVTESVLDEVRNGKRTIDEPLKSVLLSYVDLERRLIEEARSAAAEGRAIQRMPLSSQYLSRLAACKPGGAEPAAAPEPAAEAPARDVREEKLDIKTFVKVDTRRLDQLIDSIGEMCIYSSMLIRCCRDRFAGDEALVKVTHQVEKFSRDLQEIGMSMRLIPIRGLFQKMSRLVWDTSKKISKEIVFEMDGEDTELDRSIIDRLADPLMHMVRNAVDHGVETPEERRAAGKPSQGTIKLSAYHRAGSIHIRLEDDGRGLNTERLVKKAIERGILPEGAKLSESEAYQLIFAAGLSTAAKVTDISGRGVGMDVVRRNIEAMRGRVVIESKVNAGTVFTIELPLTLAIIDGIEVTAGKQTFIIPTLSVVEFSKPAPNSVHYALDRGELYEFRGKYLPVFRLGRLFQLEEGAETLDDANIVIAETQLGTVAIAVDEIIGSYSTVIKSLGPQFGVTKGVSGCGILPNGNAALIIDTSSLVTLARTDRVLPRRSEEHATEH